MGLKEELKALEAEEQELERLRGLVRPEYWPRIYELLKQVREQIKKLELLQRGAPTDRDAA